MFNARIASRYPVLLMKLASRAAHVVEEPYPLLLQLSLALALLGGFGLGLTLLFSFVLQASLPLSVGALIQAHGQVQALGFVALFIMAVATRLVPRFHGANLVHGWMVSIGGLALAVGVILRAVAQPMVLSQARGVILGSSTILTLGGVLLAVVAFGATVRRGTPTREREPVILPMTMAVSLIGSLILSLVACMGLAGGNVTVPAGLDEAILHLELWGFASTMILAIARHTWPSLLHLGPSRVKLLRVALALWALGSLGTPLVWLIDPEGSGLRMITAICQAAGVLLYVAALRLFERRAHTRLIPLVTDDGHIWLRIAIAFLIVASVINVAAALPGLVGSQLLTELSAARHSLATGFVLPVIVWMASRILPGYATRMMEHPGRMRALMTALFAGALLRAGAELVGGYADGWGAFAAIGGALTTFAFVVFATELSGTTARSRGSIDSLA